MSRLLPQHASLRQLRLQAKDLLRAYQSHEVDAISRLRAALPRLAGTSDADVAAAGCSLQDIQYVIAHEYGFEGWTALRSHVDTPPAESLAAAFEAVAANDPEALRRLLEVEPDLVQRRQSDGGNTLLHTASSLEAPDVVGRLIDAGASVNARAGEGWTPLHNAAASNRLQTLVVLLEAGADIEMEACGAGGTALVHALFYGHRESAQLLAQHSLQPLNLRVAAGLGRVDLLEELFAEDGALHLDAGRHREFYRHHDEFPAWSPSSDPQEILDEALVYASQNQHQAAVTLLLDRGAGVSGVPYYASALHFAAHNGDEQMVDLLLQHGANLSVRDNMHGGTPGAWAVHGSRPDLEDRLRGEEPPERAPSSTLFDLIDQGELHEVEARLATGAAVDETRSILWEISGKGMTMVEQTLLQACASAGRTEIGALLVTAGAHLDLHAAAFLGKRGVVEAALVAGQTVDETDSIGMTALHRAIQGSAEAVVELLLQRGADVERSADTYTFGARALHLAAASGVSRQVIERLIEAGADVNHRANPGTPMQIAQRHGHMTTVRVLRDLGAR